MTPAFRIGAVAIGPAGRQVAPLLAEAEAGIRRSAAAGAGLVVLPELFAEPYRAAEDPAGCGHPEAAPIRAWAAGLARETGTAILFGLAVPAGEGDEVSAKPVNAALLARPDGSVATAAEKIHLPPAEAGGFGEANHFSPGRPTVEAFDLGPLKVAALVCYDRRFPECWRAAAAAGAEVVAVLVAGPAAADPIGFFLAELAVHARANAVYAIAAARYGVETVTGRPVRHDGETAAVGPGGTVIDRLTEPGPGFVTIAIDRARIARARAENPTAGRLRLGPTPGTGQKTSCQEKRP